MFSMKALIQRVSSSTVSVDGRVCGTIGRGLLVFLGVMRGDTDRDVDYLSKKVTGLRVFPDGDGKMNLSVLDIEGQVLTVSQFTLSANMKKGNRPSFDRAEEPVRANRMYELFIETLSGAGIKVERGAFGEHMDVSLVNDGPVTIMIDSRNGE